MASVPREMCQIFWNKVLNWGKEKESSREWKSCPKPKKTGKVFLDILEFCKMGNVS